MIIVTGAAGFIGSCLVSHLNKKGIEWLVLVDKFDRDDKNKNLASSKFIKKIDRDLFIPWFEKEANNVDFVLHLGARTDTTETDRSIFEQLNFNYSKAIFKVCTQHQIPLIYASSAATYGLGEQGYDDESHPSLLVPLNPYGDSKNDFDEWLLAQKKQPPFWAGLKFFNVYGPNEYHKGRMASVILHSFLQINKTGGMKLFRSHRPDFNDGEQSRDFVYIKDLLAMIDFLMQEQPKSALYNIGTGRARTFYDLAKHTFLAMGKTPNISFIDTPLDIRDTYQYFTAAKMDKLRHVGYNNPVYELEDGIKDYVQNYLMKGEYY